MAGVVLAGAGTVVAVAGASQCGEERHCGVGLIGVGGLVLGFLVAEVGAPVALAGAGRERRAVRERGGDPEEGWTEVGFAMWGASFVAPLVIPVPFALAAAQHGANRRADAVGDFVGTDQRPCASRLARCRPAYGITALP